MNLDRDEASLQALQVDPALVLTGDPPQLVDEWQLDGTRVWNHVRTQVDKRGAPGQFILTGFAVPNDEVRRHCGAGRFARLMMRSMRLYESGEATGAMSLRAMLAGERPKAPADLLFESLVVRDVRVYADATDGAVYHYRVLL